MFNFSNKSKNTKKIHETISPKKVMELLNNSQYQLLDVRSLSEYTSGHIKNTLLIPLPELQSRIDELDPSKNIITICASGMRSAKAASILADSGFKVYNMQGGMSMWPGPVIR